MNQDQARGKWGIIQEKFGDTKEAIQKKLDALHVK